MVDIIVAEKNASFRSMTLNALHVSGLHHALSFTDFRTAEENIKIHKPRILIFHWGKHVEDFIQKVGSIYHKGKNPIKITIMERPTQETVSQAVKLGIKGILVRPFSAENLLDLIKKHK